MWVQYWTTLLHNKLIWLEHLTDIDTALNGRNQTTLCIFVLILYFTRGLIAQEDHCKQLCMSNILEWHINIDLDDGVVWCNYIPWLQTSAHVSARIDSTHDYRTQKERPAPFNCISVKSCWTAFVLCWAGVLLWNYHFRPPKDPEVVLEQPEVSQVTIIKFHL